MSLYGPAVLLLAVVALAANTALSVISLDRLSDASAWVEHTLKVRQQMTDVQAALVDAETAARGYLITSDQRQLGPYHLTLGNIDRRIAALKQIVADNPAQVERVENIDALARAKLNEIAESIAAHASSGAAVASRLVQESTGRGTMDRVRDIFSDMDADEMQLLDKRRVEYALALRAAYAAIAIFAASTLVLLGAVYLLMRRELRRRAAASAETEEHARRLNDSLQALEVERNETALLNETSSFLQSCNSLQELGDVAGPFLQSLLGGTPGALYLYAASRNQLSCLSTWGEVEAPPLLAPVDCWALRRGHTHHHAVGGQSPLCQHSGGDVLEETLCLPLAAHGDTLGMLTLQAHRGGRSLAPTRGLAERAARHIALTLASLRLRETLNEQSIRDPLTGAFNRRYLDIVADKEIAQARRFGRSFAVAMLDVDHFKRFNDVHGHSAGDVALITVCGYLQSHIRDGDWLFRYGGEEFVLLLRESGRLEAEEKAEELCAGIAALTVRNGPDLLPPITVSIGIAVMPEHGEELPTLLARADKALYAAKQNGRNRVIFAEQIAA